MSLLQLTYDPTWLCNGATVQCGCGIYRRYAWSHLAHSYAYDHSKLTNHMCFVQVQQWKLDRLHFIDADGVIEPEGDCS